MTRAVVDRIRASFAAHGVHGTLHARELGAGGASLGVDADVPMPLASVFKLPLVVALHRAADAGALDLTAPVELGSRTAGPTGLGAMLDPVRVSLRDLGYLAIALSDNGAADHLVDVVGLDAVRAALRDLGLPRTAIRHACRDFARTLAEDTGGADLASALAADPGLLDRLAVRDPERTNAGPAEEMTALLAAIWDQRAASPASCAAIRRVLALQVWPHRLSSGFPGFSVAGKTGTLPGVRNEVGVVERGDGRAVAIAVLTMAPTAAPSMPQLDALIGTVARIAFDALVS